MKRFYPATNRTTRTGRLLAFDSLLGAARMSSQTFKIGMTSGNHSPIKTHGHKDRSHFLEDDP